MTAKHRMKTGPKKLEARVPKRAKAARLLMIARRCRICICLQESELDANGKCVDRVACETLCPPLFEAE